MRWTGLACVLVWSSLARAGTPQIAAAHGPRLVIERATLKATGVCEAGRAIVVVDATLRNVGDAASPDFQYGLLQATSREAWGNGAYVAPIAPRASLRLQIEVYFPSQHPEWASEPATFVVQLEPEHGRGVVDTRSLRFDLPAPCRGTR